MKKFLAVVAISIFILAGCEQSSSVVAPENTNTELEKSNNEPNSLQKGAKPADPRT